MCVEGTAVVPVLKDSHIGVEDPLVAVSPHKTSGYVQNALHPASGTCTTRRRAEASGRR